MPARNRNFDEFYGVQIIGTEVKNTICAWELWRNRKHVGYAYTQPALQDPNASTGWVFRELGNGTRSGTPYQARTWEQAIVEFRKALAAEAESEENAWITADEDDLVTVTDTVGQDIVSVQAKPAAIANGVGGAAGESRSGKNLLIGVAVGACLGASIARRARKPR